MAARGRKPKPAAIHLINGNPSKISQKDLEEKMSAEAISQSITVREILPSPDWFDAVAEDEWDRILPILMEMKVVTEADLTALEMYCSSYSRWRQAEQRIDEIGMIMMTGKDKEYRQQVPEISIAHKYSKICREIMSEFGLTPSARARGIKTNETTVTPGNEVFKGMI